MKRLFLLSSILLFFTIKLTAQQDFEKENIMILPSSELIIAGSTNVNKFDCRFNIELIAAQKKVTYTQQDKVIRFKNLLLSLLTEGFDCGNKRMNSDFQDLLVCEKYPEIVINVERIELISPEYQKAFITVKLAGITNQYNFTCSDK